MCLGKIFPSSVFITVKRIFHRLVSKPSIRKPQINQTNEADRKFAAYISVKKKEKRKLQVQLMVCLVGGHNLCSHFHFPPQNDFGKNE